MDFLMLLPVIAILVLAVIGLGIATFISNLRARNMEPNKINVGTSRDFFLQLGAIVTFYACVISLITLLFDAINFAYPKVADYYSYYTPSISFQVAMIIVAFPLFIFFSWLLQKSYQTEPALRDSLVRRWFSFITISLAGGVIAGDLITILYMFLDGQELTTAFLLKVLTLIVISGGVFIYYFREIKNLIGRGERNVWRIIAVVVIIGSIIIGFSVVGSPRTQRDKRFDGQRISDLQNIQWRVVDYWQQKGVVPNNLDELKDSISNSVTYVDPQTKEPYRYERPDSLSFNLCATFKKSSEASGHMSKGLVDQTSMYPRGVSENWQHPAGYYCFERTIDPDLYPVRPR